MSVISLEDLGPRICIFGPSNSGKSTLAAAIARSRNIQATHLDQLRHLPNTNWLLRSNDEFVKLHDEAIKASEWVLDGNYPICMPQRLQLATGIILLESTILTSLWRYFRRSWFEKQRIGDLEGQKDRIRWQMVYHIVVTTPPNRRRWAEEYKLYTIPKVLLTSQKDLDIFYQAMKLDRRA